MARTLVALFRGINVGKAKRIAMPELRRLAEELGYAAPQTLLNSGNLVFELPDEDTAGGRTEESAAAAVRIQSAVAERFGVVSHVTVITAAQLNAVVRGNPLLRVATDYARLLVGVPADSESRARLEELSGDHWKPEILAAVGPAAYLWLPEGVRDSRLVRELNRVLGDAITMRNWKTVLRLNELVHTEDT